MACEHCETTVLLHLFGESPPWYAGHLATCEDCQEAMAEHAVTVGLVEGALREPPADLDGPTMEHIQVPRLDAEVIPLRPTGATGRVAPWAAAVAAVVLVTVSVAVMNRVDAPPPVADAPVVHVEPWVDPIAAELDLLDAEIDALARDMEEM